MEKNYKFGYKSVKGLGWIMKLVGKSKKSEGEQKIVFFVCIENSGSRMAKGFFRKYAPRGYTTFSAGTKPSVEINTLAIQVMKNIA